MPSMIEYLNSYGCRYQIPKKSMAFLRTRPKKHVLSEVKELTERIKKRHGKTASITQHDVSLELGVKMELIRQVFSELILDGTLHQVDKDKFDIKG